MAFDAALIITVVLLSLTAVVALLYYGRIRRASKAYEDAKSVVSDIAISFDRQLQRVGEHIEVLLHKVEAETGKSERLASRLTEHERSLEARFADVTSKAAKPPDIDVVKTDLQSLKTQLQDLVKAQEELKEHAVTVSEAQAHIETAIPIRRERALAPLTETELRVLEYVAASGEKTAPEIKIEIKLTREHTARLMKKLYEEGYLERRSEKTPYAYRVKEEMLEFLKKREVKAS